MSAPASAQSFLHASPAILNTMVETYPEGIEFPVCGDRTTKAAPLYATIAELHQAKDEAGRVQREKAHHTP